jgi:type IV pilus biogenesis protein CpaD/CtpE
METPEMFCKAVSAALAAAIVAALSCMSADARTKPQRPYEVRTPAPDARRSQTPSLDGRITGRSRTCGFDTFQYDGFGVPYGPYCH